MKKKPPRESAKHSVAPPAQEEAPLWRAVLREPFALGLVLLMLVRPWLDGITYPTDNFYFIWGAIVLFAVWAVRLLLRGEPIRFGLPVGLLAGFWVVAVLTGLTSVEWESTYRGIIVWTGHFCLFVLGANVIRTPLAFGIVLGGFVATELIQSIWSIVHFRYVLPYVREQLIHSPRLSQMYFGTSSPGPELIHRLQVNRAFGSLLFPNALAAFLILAIPLALGDGARSLVLFARSVRAWRPGSSPSGPEIVSRERGSRAAMLLVFGLFWLLTFVILFFLFAFVADYEFPTGAGAIRVGPFVHSASGLALAEGRYLVNWFLVVVALPLLLAGGMAYVVRNYGLPVFGLALRVWTLPPLLVTASAALWLTYSRGGMLALFGAMAFTVGLLFLRKRNATVPVATAAACLLTGLALMASGALAQPPAPQPTQAVASEEVPAGESAGPAVNQDTSESEGASEPGASASPLVGGGAITREGKHLTFGDLASPASFWLRTSYWRTGLDMALDNLVTGVGLGNFGAAYPRYQRLGAGDVKAAHNDYLQALCETGIVGAALFALFWGYFVVWGARRVWREADRLRRWSLAGMYAGILAFLLHSAIDFNFFNPALAFFAFLLAGLFYARADAPETVSRPVGGGSRRQLLAVPLLIVAALVSGMAFRVWLRDYLISDSIVSVGNHLKLDDYFNSGRFFFQQFDLKAVRARRYPVTDVLSAVRILPDRAALSSFGAIRVPSNSSTGGHRALRADEAIPPEAFYALTKPYAAMATARNYVDDTLARYKAADSIFPHDPELAMYFVRWYELLTSTVGHDEPRLKYTIEFVAWAEAAVARSPQFFLYREYLGRALWARGNLDTGPNRMENFEKAIREYQKATELYPISARSWHTYGEALLKLGKALKDTGQVEAGEARIAEGEQARAHARELEQGGGAA